VIKQAIRQAFVRCGLDVRPLTSLPFGEDWRRDLQYCANGGSVDTLFDVGANLGQTAFAVAEFFPNCRVYCFEPVPSTFDELKLRTKTFPKIVPVRSALADRQGSLSMLAQPLSLTNRVMQPPDFAENKLQMVEVRVDTVDAFCKENSIQRIGLLKIDTEGYELKVLAGARRMLSTGAVDYILAECDFLPRPSEPHGYFADIFNHLREFNFNVVAFYNGGVDDLGWVWGDVLFRKVLDDKGGRVSMSPLARRA
jgi:FkbM family methyltransferase